MHSNDVLTTGDTAIIRLDAYKVSDFQTAKIVALSAVRLSKLLDSRKFRASRLKSPDSADARRVSLQVIHVATHRLI